MNAAVTTFGTMTVFAGVITVSEFGAALKVDAVLQEVGTATDRESILEKLRKIEALFAGAKTPGEKQAAEAARERIRAKLKSLESVEQPMEWRFSLHNPWSRRLLIALLRRYGIEAYRRAGQKRTSILAKMPKTFAEQTLIPEFQSLDQVLQNHLSQVADKIISEAIFSKVSDI